MGPMSVLVGVGVVLVAVAVVVIDSRKMLVQTLVMKDERQPIPTVSHSISGQGVR